MGRMKVKVCTGKRCAGRGAEALLEIGDALTESQRERTKVKETGCLGHCGKKKHGDPPFVEIDGDLLAEATPKRLREKLVEALDKA